MARPPRRFLRAFSFLPDLNRSGGCASKPLRSIASGPHVPPRLIASARLSGVDEGRFPVLEVNSLIRPQCFVSFRPLEIRSGLRYPRPMSAHRYNLPPGPPAKPLVGHLLDYRRDPVGFMVRLARRHGDIAYFKLGSQGVVLLSHPDHIKTVLTIDHRNFTKGKMLQWAKRLLGEGLLTSEGDFHRRQRRIAQPAFHRARIAAYGEVIVQYS